MIELEGLLSRLPAEATDAVIGMARLKSTDLARHLREKLGAKAGDRGSFLSEPHLEGAFPWLPVDFGWDGVDPGLLHPKTVETLRQVSPFPPYAHQVDAWSTLAARNRLRSSCPAAPVRERRSASSLPYWIVW
jgi:DEAD/DEAH box helicase domain-containing protein